MKITEAWVDDPTEVGVALEPILCVSIDESPSLTREDTLVSGVTITQRGPFFQLRTPTGSVLSAGEYNAKFRVRPRESQCLVDIALSLNDSDAEEGWAIHLSRGKSLLRKYADTWRLYLNERHAESEGRLTWIPVSTSPTCRWSSRLFDGYKEEGEICGAVPARVIRALGIDIPLCKEHITEHNHRQAKARAS